MSSTNIMLLAGAIVVGGTWAKKKEFNGKIVIGTAFAVIFVSLIGSVDDEIGKMFAWLILLGASYAYIPPILKGLKLS